MGRFAPVEVTGQVPFASALRFWLKLGFISFGGPAGQISIMHQELVERRRWIPEERFLHALNFCMLLPGPEAQQLATYIGWLLHRTWGGLAAGALFILPSLGILIGLSYLYVSFGEVPAVSAFFFGIKPAVVAIVALAAWRLGRRVLGHAALIAIAAAAFVGLWFFAVPFPLIVLGAAIAGGVGGRFWPQYFKAASATLVAAHPPPEPGGFSPARMLWILAAGVILWLATMAVLVALQGREGVLPQMGAFFTQAALVTFGGAYAVLPYVHQGAVEQHGWVTAAQMIDGLALGETTPGPLVMICTFVGYVGGWSLAAVQGLSPAWAGFVAAVTVTWFTFLPSFVFVFAGAPLIEASRGRRYLVAPLTAISAAVVGVIVNLAVFFAWQVFWPGGIAAMPDPASLLIFAGAGVALFRFQVGVIPVILAAGALGMLIRLSAG